jgi:hypothetical protein
VAKYSKAAQTIDFAGYFNCDDNLDDSIALRKESIKKTRAITA